jgi:outer membrane protein assembly factor BamB
VEVGDQREHAVAGRGDLELLGIEFPELFSRWPSLAIVVLACCWCPRASAEGADPPATWPQWRGTGRDGVDRQGRWPQTLAGDALRPKWRVPLAPSYSGPIVAEKMVFVTETVDEQTEVVRALDRETGEEVWRKSWPGTLSVPFFAKANGDWIRATPAYDGESLFVAGMRDVLVCLNASTGAERWRVDFVEQLHSPLPSFGFVSSPLVVDESVYVQAGGSVVRLNKRTGKIEWRALQDGGGMYGSAFSSPVLATLAGRRQLLVQTRQLLAGLDPHDGQVLWSQEIEAFRGMNILTPTVWNDHVFTSSYGGGSFLFRVRSEAGRMSVEPVWRNKVQGYMSSPIVVDDMVYVHLRNQRFACLDLETGRERWISRPYGKYWSLASQGKLLLALDERGDLLLIRANADNFDLLDSRHLSDSSTWAHVAVCDAEIYVRDLHGLTVYYWTAPPE